MKEIKYNRDCGIVECCEENCPFLRECANHRTAGDFRTEDGVRPRLHYRLGKLMCESIDSPIDERYLPYQTYPVICDPRVDDLAAVTWHQIIEKTDAYEI